MTQEIRFAPDSDIVVEDSEDDFSSKPEAIASVLKTARKLHKKYRITQLWDWQGLPGRPMYLVPLSSDANHQWATNWIPSLLIYGYAINKYLLATHGEEDKPRVFEVCHVQFTVDNPHRPGAGVFTTTIDDYLQYTEINDYGYVIRGRFSYTEDLNSLSRHFADENWQGDRQRYYPKKVLELL